MSASSHPGTRRSSSAGPKAPHHVANRSDRPARFLIVSTMAHPEVAYYPESDTIGLFAGAPPVPGESAPIELVFDARRAGQGRERSAM